MLCPGVGRGIEDYGDSAKIPGIDGQEHAVLLNPYNAEIFNNLGVAMNSAGNRKEAAKAYKKALRFNPALDKAWFNLGNIYIEDNNFIKAAYCFKMALQINPSLKEAEINYKYSISRAHK